jgi:hypothetical protein
MPAKSVNTLSSSARSNFPAPLPGIGSSVNTERFKPVKGGQESPFASEGGMAVIFGADEVNEYGASVVVSDRGLVGEKGLGDNSAGSEI